MSERSGRNRPLCEAPCAKAYDVPYVVPGTPEYVIIPAVSLEFRIAVLADFRRVISSKLKRVIIYMYIYVIIYVYTY